MTLTPAPTQLRVVLHEVATLMRALAQDKKLNFSVETQAEIPPWVLADPTRLKQIIFNLISNAIKFTEQGSVTLTVVPHPRTDGNVGLAFLVRDTGIGMDDHVLAKLFQRFYQVDGGLARKFGGTGLGLEISQTLARMMGGAIEVESKPGEGSLFTLHLPFTPCPAPPQAQPTPEAALAAEASGQALRVLVAEDHPVNRKFVGILLDKMGYQATFCENGQLALEAAQNAEFDLVLMDVHMPVMDGLTATRGIRALPGTMAEVPIIALTADVMNDAKDQALAAGVNAFVTKPVQVNQLQEVIRQCLAGESPFQPPTQAQ
jgi:CheY-like chemotaxis protein